MRGLMAKPVGVWKIIETPIISNSKEGLCRCFEYFKLDPRRPPKGPSADNRVFIEEPRTPVTWNPPSGRRWRRNCYHQKPGRLRPPKLPAFKMARHRRMAGTVCRFAGRRVILLAAPRARTCANPATKQGRGQARHADGRDACRRHPAGRQSREVERSVVPDLRTRQRQSCGKCYGPRFGPRARRSTTARRSGVIAAPVESGEPGTQLTMRHVSTSAARRASRSTSSRSWKSNLRRAKLTIQETRPIARNSEGLYRVARWVRKHGGLDTIPDGPMAPRACDPTAFSTAAARARR